MGHTFHPRWENNSRISVGTYTVKLNPDGALARLKAQLMAKLKNMCRLQYLQSQRWLQLGCLFHWRLHIISLHTSWILRMCSFIAFMRKKFIWSNHLGLLLGEYGKVCHLWKLLYGSKQSPDLSLEGLAMWFRSLVSVFLRKIINFSSASIRKKTYSLTIYVDDTVILGDDVQGINNFQLHLW